MEKFLKSVEKKAFSMIRIATGNTDEALDLLQDSMMKFVGKYGEKSREEWKPLFYRIVQNKIRDWYRKEKIRKMVFAWIPGRGKSASKKEVDPIQTAADRNIFEPMDRLKTHQAMRTLTSVLNRLPARQQQVFLLRAWEGLSVADTAQIMNCTQGTVKTHYSRAINKLKNKLEGVWP